MTHRPRSLHPSNPHAPIRSADELNARIDDAWDAGRDPLDEPAIQTFLGEHPELLEAFAGARADLLALAGTTRVPTETVRTAAVRRRALRTGVAVAAAAALLWLASRRFETETHRPGPQDLGADIASRPRVLATELAFETRRARRGRIVVDTHSHFEENAPRLRIHITETVHRLR